ncbi:MAG: translation initiation factor IF-3 [Patescibacteria group bacterium]
MNQRVRINRGIRAAEVRLIGSNGENIGVVSTDEALKKAEAEQLDLIEISPNAVPPVAKIMDYGKFQYVESKKERDAKAKSHTTETKSLQIKIGTGEHDLALKAKKATEWLKEGHRVQMELFLSGRAKYMKEDFLKERLNRILVLIAGDYKIADGPRRGPKGLSVVLERAAKQTRHQSTNGHE